MSEASITLFGVEMNPSATVKLFGMSFYWSGVLLAIAFVCAMCYALWRGKKYGITGDALTDAMICGIPAGIVGARIVYVLEHVSDYAGNLAGIVRIWDGGLELTGGILFAVAAMWLCCRKKKISFPALLDTLAPSLLLGGVIGVWGSFFQRSGYGKETLLPWKMGLTLSGETVSVHPLFLYAFLWLLIGFVALHVLSQKRQRRFDGQIAAMAAVWYGLYPVMTVPLEADYAETFSISRLIGALLLCGGILVLVYQHLHGTAQPLYIDRVETEVPEEAAEEDDAQALQRMAEETGSVPMEEAAPVSEPENEEEEGFEPFGDAIEAAPEEQTEKE